MKTYLKEMHVVETQEHDCNHLSVVLITLKYITKKFKIRDICIYLFFLIIRLNNFRFSYLKNYKRLSQSIFLYRKNIAKKKS